MLPKKRNSQITLFNIIRLILLLIPVWKLVNEMIGKNRRA